MFDNDVRLELGSRFTMSYIFVRLICFLQLQNYILHLP